MEKRYFLREIDKEFLTKEFEQIGVDITGQKIMAKKTPALLIKVHCLPFAAANILKQEFLSRGGDAAINKNCVSGQIQNSDAVIIATPKIIAETAVKLKTQQFGLKNLAEDLFKLISDKNNTAKEIKAGAYTLKTEHSPFIMGILNMTPDSCSLDGLRPDNHKELEKRIGQMIAEGADIIDIGGESTRPGAKDITADIEIERIKMALEIAVQTNIPVSVDTRHYECARYAIERGVSIINDVSGLKFQPKIIEILKDSNAAVVINHTRGNPQNMNSFAKYNSFMDELYFELNELFEDALYNGIKEEKIILDPGFGFAKNSEHNIELLKRLGELKIFGRPILAGMSRKRFLTEIVNSDTIGKRDAATLVANIIAVQKGADILRVHNVALAKEAISTLNSLNE